MPSREEIARWLREAGEKHCIGHKYPTFSKLYEERSLQVENMRCENCNSKDELLKEMADALEEIVRCLSHGLQDSRASVTAKAMLQKYHEQNGEPK